MGFERAPSSSSRAMKADRRVAAPRRGPRRRSVAGRGRDAAFDVAGARRQDRGARRRSSPASSRRQKIPRGRCRRSSRSRSASARSSSSAGTASTTRSTSHHAALDPWDKGAREVLQARRPPPRRSSATIFDGPRRRARANARRRGGRRGGGARDPARRRYDTAHGDPPGRGEGARARASLNVPDERSSLRRASCAQRFAAREAWSKLAGLHRQATPTQANKEPTEKVEALLSRRGRPPDPRRRRASRGGDSAPRFRRRPEGTSRTS